MDISETLAPASDQLDAIELVEPRTFTIANVSKGSAEQPINVGLVGFPRPWRPGKSMRRVLAHCWGTDASQWAGRRVTLYCDPDVIFGKDKVGGTRISHLSDIDGVKTVPLLVSRGKSQLYTVQPLADEPTITPDTLTELGALFARKGIPAAAHLSGAGKIIGHAITSLDTITEAEAQRVIAALHQRADKEPDHD